MKISVIGGGYVGLISALGLAELGCDVTIIEIYKIKADLLSNAKSPIFEQGLKEISKSKCKYNHVGNKKYDRWYNVTKR